LETTEYEPEGGDALIEMVKGNVVKKE